MDGRRLALQNWGAYRHILRHQEHDFTKQPAVQGQASEGPNTVAVKDHPNVAAPIIAAHPSIAVPPFRPSKLLESSIIILEARKHWKTGAFCKIILLGPQRPDLGRLGCVVESFSSQSLRCRRCTASANSQHPSDLQCHCV